MENSLGKTLRKTRESAGISVDDAVYLARIPRSVVLALEDEDFGFFTSPLYARSFLRQYGDYIGADVEPWIDDLVPATMIDGEAVESFVDISEPVAAAVTREKPPKSNGTFAAIWMILITAGLVWGGLEIYKNFEANLAEETPETVRTDEEPADEGETVSTAEEPVPEEIPPEEKDNVPEPPKRAIIVDLPE